MSVYILLSILLAFFMGTYMATFVWCDHCAQATIKSFLDVEAREVAFAACVDYTCLLYRSNSAFYKALKDGMAYHFTCMPPGGEYRCSCTCCWHDQKNHIIRLTCLCNKINKKGLFGGMRDVSRVIFINLDKR